MKKRVQFPRSTSSDSNEKPISCNRVCNGPGESVIFADIANDSVRRITDSPPTLDVVYRSELTRNATACTVQGTVCTVQFSTYNFHTIVHSIFLILYSGTVHKFRCAENRVLKTVALVKRRDDSGSEDLLFAGEATANLLSPQFTVEIAKWNGKRYFTVQ